MVMQLIISSEKDAVMIPVPQYPLYATAIALNGGSLVCNRDQLSTV